jgi:hypothetical protein
MEVVISFHSENQLSAFGRNKVNGLERQAATSYFSHWFLFL